ncbi:hypothetical protein STEG23_006930 [Scotinomys teguina]
MFTTGSFLEQASSASFTEAQKWSHCILPTRLASDTGCYAFPTSVDFIPQELTRTAALRTESRMCRLSWFLDPGGWSKATVVGLYFIFPGICTLSLQKREKGGKGSGGERKKKGEPGRSVPLGGNDEAAVIQTSGQAAHVSGECYTGITCISYNTAGHQRKTLSEDDCQNLLDYRTPAYGMVLLTYRVGIPISITSVWKVSQAHAQKPVSYVILGLMKLWTTPTVQSGDEARVVKHDGKSSALKGVTCSTDKLQLAAMADDDECGAKDNSDAEETEEKSLVLLTLELKPLNCVTLERLP